MVGPRQPLPKNWPEGFPYLTSPGYSPSLTKSQLLSCRTKPSATDEVLREIPCDLKPGPCPHVRITPISDPRHPACGQSGLFATRPLPPGSLIMPYYGEYHPADSEAHASSDYDLWLDRDAAVAVDAARMGNEARFVNDYRGVPGAVKPNAEFCEVWDARRSEKGMAIFVLPVGKKFKGKGGGIAKGEEILLSYGKGFWGKRRGKMDEEEAEG